MQASRKMYVRAVFQYVALAEILIREITAEDDEAPVFGISHDRPPVADGDEEKEGQPKQDVKVVDPLRWFGVLVPPALRSAQSSFVKVTEGPMIQIATLSKALRGLEIEIGRQRKAIRKLEKS
jgi:hypothetical protein